MKKIAFGMFLIICANLTSCKNPNNKNTDTINDNASDTLQIQKDEAKMDDTSGGEFDINSIPVSDTELGVFPFIKLPDGYTFNDSKSRKGNGVIKDYDKEYFYDHGIYVPVEGKTFKATIRIDRNEKEKTFSKLELEKGFDDLMNRAKAVKINNGEDVKDGEKDRLKEIDPDAFRDGYKHSSSIYKNVHSYVIRRQNANIWLQYNIGRDVMYITVLETKSFDNNMDFLPASQIKKELDTKGKAVLHINFDTNKATLKTEGKQAVAEIVKTLQADNELKIAINGYTDNTGNNSHSLQLSKDRAETVKKTIVSSGIDTNRLTSDGFGSKDPISDNDTEEGKAQNRRVELLKL